MIKNVGYTICYRADMRDLFQLMLNREKDVVEVHKLLGAMFECIYYRRILLQKSTPECETHARWSRQFADSDLEELMRAWCLNDMEKNLIRSLVRRSV